jgi:hypothetical protein
VGRCKQFDLSFEAYKAVVDLKKVPLPAPCSVAIRGSRNQKEGYHLFRYERECSSLATLL